MSLAAGAQYSLVVIFVFAALEKVGVLRTHSAGWHPMLLAASWRRRHAAQLVAAALLVDGAAVGLLLASPRIGAVAAITIVAGYTLVALAEGDHSAPRNCQCFWKFFNSVDSKGLIARNTVLIAFGAAVGLAIPQPSVRGVMWAVPCLAIVAAVSAVGSHGTRHRSAEMARGTARMDLRTAKALGRTNGE